MPDNDREPGNFRTRQAGDCATTALHLQAGTVWIRGTLCWVTSDVRDSVAARVTDPVLWVRGVPTLRLGTGVFLP